MSSKNLYPKPRVLAVVVGLIGVLLLWQGVLLLQVGGSWYYTLAGIALVVCSVLLFRGDARGA